MKHIIVVGGFGSSRVLTERIFNEFHLKGGVRVVLSDPTPKPQGAIALGAVYFGLYKEIIRARVSQYEERFDIIVSKGEELPIDHAVGLVGLPISPTATSISWRVYRSDKREPTTVTGSTCWVSCLHTG